MFTIRNSEFIRFDSQGRSVERLELDLDTSADLPGAQNGEVAVSGRVAVQGSIAWDISTGDFYGLKSDGAWCKQDGTDASSNDAAPSVEPGRDMRKLSEEVNEDIAEHESLEDEIEEGTEDDEPIRDFESR